MKINLKVGFITLISQFLINNKNKSINFNNKKLDHNDIFNNRYNKILIIPITAYIIKGMDMIVNDTSISNDITKQQIKLIFEDVNNFFASSNIYWKKQKNF